MKKTTKKEELPKVVAPDVKALFAEKAPRGNFGVKVYNALVKEGGTNFLMGMTLDQILAVPGVGRRGALIAVEVAADLAGKK